jgi:DNA topoisomerase-1
MRTVALRKTAPLTPEDIARRARLRYISDGEAGIVRKRRGRGFIYETSGGARLTVSNHLERIAALAIPPAWTDVWICRFAKGHIQATGRDSKGRKQYIYHARWQETTGLAKFSGLAAFGRLLPKIRRKVEEDLSLKGLPYEKVAALAVHLLDETGMRIGNREYAADNDSYGLTTLQNRHVRIDGSRLIFCFRAKAGLKCRLELDNPALAKLVESCRTNSKGTLLQYENGTGYQPLSSYDVNAYLSAFSPEISAKLFRTWHGSRAAAEFLYHADPPHSRSARARLIPKAIRHAAEHLQNTITVCRKYYIHPQIPALFLAGRFPDAFENFTPRAKKRMTKADEILLRILEYPFGDSIKSS